MFIDTTATEINSIMQQAWHAYFIFRNKSLEERAAFMKAIAAEIEACGDDLIQTAMQETNLPEARLRNERARTMYQLTSYADACVKGDWLEVRIDKPIADKTPPRPDIRKMNMPLGPVVVFGSSNFPFAYSTAGGDTATAFAAGCPVIVKAHPAHPKTSTIVANAILIAAQKTNMPTGVFAHVYGSSFAVGEQLVMNEYTKAVGFTGSFSGGKALFDLANKRKEPIPVFAEMGSTNPVFLLQNKLENEAVSIAKNIAASYTLGCGQFCTKPGLLIGVESTALNTFIEQLKLETQSLVPAKMLHTGIQKAYIEKKNLALAQNDVTLLANSNANADEASGQPTVAIVKANTFLQNTILHQEVFGPYALIITCATKDEMQAVATELEGQLTATLMATEEDVKNETSLIETIKNKCGRLILNNVPTGVEVCLAMHHGGPYPSSTDSRFTSVGADAIKRFVRPISFQNWPNSLLPDAIKDENLLNLHQTIN